MKGIILAGGSGTRLHPVTKAISKQLIPINDKPMIYYPLSVLIMARIKEILIISTPEDLPSYKRLLGDGSSIGLSLSYIEQPEPDGIAKAFILAEEFIKNDQVTLILGDNIFYGYDFSKLLVDNVKNIKKGATIFSYEVSDPERFGVVEIDKKRNVLSLEEKPKRPKSNQAVVGLYIYDNKVVEHAKKLKPSARGELEITDLNKKYLQLNQLSVATLGKGFAWLDTGTPESLLEASHFVSTIEKRQGIKIGCIEEAAYKNHWISKKQLKKISEGMRNTSYGKYLEKL
jgi:glucose-1-phosphate thymidylyltransferase|tara:strand:+ start:8156 stop:9016 length:861 start_codon:yes stop_codon:yes gene_type:complete